MDEAYNNGYENAQRALKLGCHKHVKEVCERLDGENEQFDMGYKQAYVDYIERQAKLKGIINSNKSQSEKELEIIQEIANTDVLDALEKVNLIRQYVMHDYGTLSDILGVL